MAVNGAIPEGLKIAVLCGGPSAEREVSLVSGGCVFEALKSAGADVEKIELVGNKLEELKGKKIDVAFIACHGAFGEDGTMQKLLDDCGLPYTGSGPHACEIAFDKDLTKKKLLLNKVPTPNWAVIKKGENARQILEHAKLQLPLVVKPVRGGSSIGITLANDWKTFDCGLEAAFVHDDTVMVEALIVGKEFTVGVLEGKALPVIELRTKRKFYDYQAKYEDNDTEYLCPAPLSTPVTTMLQKCAVDTFNAVGARDFSRIDILIDAAMNPQVLEINIIPGFTSHSLLPKAAAAAGLPFPQLCLKMLSLAWARANK